MVSRRSDGDAGVRSVVLEDAQEPPAEPDPARIGRDPHALHVGASAGVVAQPTAADRPAALARNQEEACRRREVLDLDPRAPSRIEAVLEAVGELAQVLLDAPARVVARRILDVDRDRGGEQEPLDLCHRSGERAAAPLVERLQDRSGEAIRAAVELRALGEAGRREAGAAHPAVVGGGLDHDQALGLERPQQPARVAGIHPQALPQIPHLGPAGADLPQEARLAQRTATAEELLVERTHALRHRAVEAPHPTDELAWSFSDFSQRILRGQG